jgi:thiamine-phosphate pyrophosphorylase
VERIAELGRQSGATVIVNDRADIARITAAAGVHLGQDDLPPASARSILGDAAIVGWSTHTPDQIEGGLTQPISYLAIGPVFGSSTKATGYDAVGLAAVAHAAERCRARGLPLVAIGGITLDSAVSVIEAGASAVAVIGDLLSTGDPEARVRAYLQRVAASSNV